MSNFLYFLPDLKNAPIKWEKIPAPIRAILVEPTFDSCRVSGAGPTGHPGVILAAGRAKSGKQAKVNYHGEKQTWRKVSIALENGAEPSSYWLGFWNDDRPTPDDLSRSRITDGHAEPLADGNEWTLPAVHANWNTLPESFDIDDSGEVIVKVCSGYEEIQAEAEKWHEMMMSEELIEFDRPDWFRFACKLLAINYQAGPHECVALDLFRTTGDIMYAVILCACDNPALQAEREARAKKKAEDTPPDGIEASPGEEGSTPSTLQPMPT